MALSNTSVDKTVSIKSANSNSTNTDSQDNSQTTTQRSLTIESKTSQSKTSPSNQATSGGQNSQNNTQTSGNSSTNSSINSSTSRVDRVTNKDNSNTQVNNSTSQTSSPVSSNSSTSSNSNQSSNSNTSSDSNTSNNNRPLPVQFIRNYYAAINQGEFSSSWNRLSPELQNNRRLHPNGYASYTAWWGDKVSRVDIEAVNLVQAGKDTATVDANLRYLLKTGRSVPSKVQFSLLWDESNQRWTISDTQ